MRAFRIAIGWVVLLASGIAVQAEVRTFTSREGKPLEAEIVSADRSHVELKTKDGRTFRVPLDKLSDDDQLYIGIWRDEQDRQARFEGVTVKEILAAQGIMPATLRIEDGLMLVEASVNGKQARFLLDPRQDTSLLDEPAVQKLELELGAAGPELGAAQGVRGQVEIPSFKFGDTELGPLKMVVFSFENMAAGVREKIDGILGIGFLKDHSAWLDYGEMMLYLQPRK